MKLRDQRFWKLIDTRFSRIIELISIAGPIETAISEVIPRLSIANQRVILAYASPHVEWMQGDIVYRNSRASMRDRDLEGDNS